MRWWVAGLWNAPEPETLEIKGPYTIVRRGIGSASLNGGLIDGRVRKQAESQLLPIKKILRLTRIGIKIFQHRRKRQLIRTY